MIKDIPRPKDWMENPYIGKDGRDYHTLEALKVANAEFNRVMSRTDLASIAIKANNRDSQRYKREQEVLLAKGEYDLAMIEARGIERLADDLNISKTERNRMYDDAAQIRVRAVKPHYNF